MATIIGSLRQQFLQQMDEMKNLVHYLDSTVVDDVDQIKTALRGLQGVREDLAKAFPEDDDNLRILIRAPARARGNNKDIMRVIKEGKGFENEKKRKRKRKKNKKKKKKKKKKKTKKMKEKSGAPTRNNATSSVQVESKDAQDRRTQRRGAEEERTDSVGQSHSQQAETGGESARHTATSCGD
jgi:hypothetical protein